MPTNDKASFFFKLIFGLFPSEGSNETKLIAAHFLHDPVGCMTLQAMPVECFEHKKIEDLTYLRVFDINEAESSNFYTKIKSFERNNASYSFTHKSPNNVHAVFKR